VRHRTVWCHWSSQSIAGDTADPIAARPRYLAAVARYELKARCHFGNHLARFADLAGLGWRTVARTQAIGLGVSGTLASTTWATGIRCGPRDHDATAAIKQAMIANRNASCSPERNGAEISDGK
jgi:hypothetical protein